MRVLFLGNNWTGWQVLQYLKKSGEEIAGLALHPEGRHRFRDELIETAALPAASILDGSRLSDPRVLEKIRGLKADIAVSVFFGYILKPDFLTMFPRGCINLHPALLPWNRGTYPNVWSIIDGTPAGVTLHYMDAGVDTGDIIARSEVKVEPVDTGETLYRKLESECVSLFAKNWPQIRSGSAPRLRQGTAEGTSHRLRDVEAIDEVDLDRTCRAGDLIDLIRARTFPPYRGAYFLHRGRKVFMRMELFYEGTGGKHD